jgi:hypothetical protein
MPATLRRKDRSPASPAVEQPAASLTARPTARPGADSGRTEALERSIPGAQLPHTRG